MVRGRVPSRVRMGCYKLPVTLLVTEVTEVTMNEQLSTEQGLGDRWIDAAQRQHIAIINRKLASVLLSGLDHPVQGKEVETMAHMRKRAIAILEAEGF